MMKHTFVVCAYKKSEYLEQCVESLVNQTLKTHVVICTSTPSEFITSIADKFGVQLLVRKGESDIQDDWNFACSQVDSEWVTVAHQDDIYYPDYAKCIVQAVEQNPESIIAFSDYVPIIHGKPSMDINCRLRHLLRAPMKSKLLSKSHFFKKYCLAFGNCICCPTVTYHKALIDGPIFTSELKFSLDWDTYLKYSYYKERFLYVDKPLAYYRIHEEATTKDFIVSNRREAEDRYMFNQFWPKWITNILMRLYVKAYKTYD